MPKRITRFHYAATVVPVLAALTIIGAVAENGAQGERTSLVAAYNASGQQLFQLLAAQSGNIVFSPYSVGLAMAMTLSGARGETEQEMAKVLKHRLARTDIDTASGAVLKIINAYDTSAMQPTCPVGSDLKKARCEAPPTARLLIANALMLTRRGDIISEDYAALLSEKYEAKIFQDVGLEDINNWVKAKTNEKIDKILDVLDPSTPAVLVNAVYFKARWKSVFDKKRTKDGIFHLTRSSDTTVPTMHQTLSYSLATEAGYRAIRMPYEVAPLAMVIVLPDEIDGVDAVSKRIGVDELTGLLKKLREGQSFKSVALALPRFRTSFKDNLAPRFQQSGMSNAFDRQAADFSGMTGRSPNNDGLMIGRIEHRAVLEVMEESTEAAAATAVVMVPRAATWPSQPPDVFNIDRPFLFYIVDDATGAILFQGRIVDPR